MINKLITRIKETNAPIVVGLDPMMKFVPEYIKKAAFTEYGETLEGAAEAIWQYNKGIVDAIYDLVPAVKPQVAMYEQFGIPGMVAFKKTVDYCKEKGLIVIGDIKRGDIGSTSEAYAVGHLGKVQVGSRSYYGFDEDFVTVNPYLGSDGVNPFVKICKEENKGIFVLVQKRAFENNKIEFVWDSVVQEIRGENTVNSIVLKNVKTETETILVTDGVFPYIGIVPNVTDFSGQLEQDRNGFIKTDATMATSVDGVFAVGDVRNTPLRQVITAASDGAIAAVYAVKYVEEVAMLHKY